PGHAEARGERARLGPWIRLLAALLERLHDRRAAVRLRRHESWTLPVDPADRGELVERLPHSDETDPAAGRIDDHVGKAPPQLFRELEAHRRLALDAERLAEVPRVVPARP